MSTVGPAHNTPFLPSGVRKDCSKEMEGDVIRWPLASGISAVELAADANGFSGADIQGVCTRAAMRAVRRAVIRRIGEGAEEVSVVVEPGDLQAALEEARQR